MTKKIKNRLLIVLVILGLILVTVVPAIASTFPDMQDHWAEDTVEWGVENNITLGFPDGNFRPNYSVNEAEFLAMLLRAFGKSVDIDENNTHWADGYYEIAELFNMPLRGTEDVSLRSLPIKREQVAEIIAGTQGYNFEGRYAILSLLLQGLAQGSDPNNITIANFARNSELTRAEAVQFIKNVLDNGLDELQIRPIDPSPALPPFGDYDHVFGTLPDEEYEGDTYYLLEGEPQPLEPGVSGELLRPTAWDLRHAVEDQMTALGFTPRGTNPNVGMVSFFGSSYLEATGRELANASERVSYELHPTGMVALGIANVNHASSMDALRVIIEAINAPHHDHLFDMIERSGNAAQGTWAANTYVDVGNYRYFLHSTPTGTGVTINIHPNPSGN